VVCARGDKPFLLVSVRPKVAVVAHNLPIKENIFHARTCADVVDDHVARPKLLRFLIHDDSNVRHGATQVPRYEVARNVIRSVFGDWQALAVAREKNHEVRDATLVDVRIRS